MEDTTRAEDSASILLLASGDGAKARVHLNGAHVASWSPAGETEDRLFVSVKSGFGPGVSVRGGIPICFPQFGSMGTLPQHGFARVSPWTLLHKEEGGDHAVAVLRLIDSDATRALWPHAFSAELTVKIGGPTMDVALAVTNSGDAPFSFTAALHPYFRVPDAYACTVTGLGGTTYRDALRDGSLHQETSDTLAITDALDRVYLEVPGPVHLRHPDRVLKIERRGFPDVVVWNPGKEGVDRRADFHDGDERRMVCVEAAAVQHPIVLGAGERWEGAQRMEALTGRG
ncbi:MAG TPA: D-hexose-6-phosphate mutarotase [Gemmatimonas sp.]|nr:D-hexose-6-phosphate mutarotase [Gemmatimonas sp.]